MLVNNENYKIIVARYSEDVEWLENISDKCIILNKGQQLNALNEIMLKNVGRESHSYLWYIIENYDNLPDICVFTQGKISDHNLYGDTPDKYLLRLKLEAEMYEKSKPRVTFDYNTNSFKWFMPDWNYCLDNFYYFNDNNYRHKKLILFIDWFKQFIQPTYPNPMHIYTNALFAVKKELILKHPIEYYKKLIKEVEYNVNPVEGHFFERSWYYIFN